jgi:hypothetical protein
MEAKLARTRFALARPRASCQLQASTPAGEVTLDAATYAPVLDVLARAPMTFEELSRSPECAKLERSKLRQAAFGMTAFGNVLPALPVEGEPERRKRITRFNRAVLSTPPSGPADRFLASPVLGAGVAVNFIDQLFLAEPRDEAQAASNVAKKIAASGNKLRKGDKVLETPADIESFIKERAKFFFSDFLPFLKLLRAVD